MLTPWEVYTLGFHEKSALACLISICAVYIPYFAVVFRFPMSSLALIWISVIGLVVLLIAFHLGIAIATRSIRKTGDVPPEDELYQAIEATAAKWAGLILALAVFAWILVAMNSLPLIGSHAVEHARGRGGEVSPSDFAVPVLTAMAAVQGLFAAFVFANVVYYGGIVIGYRRLAHA